MGILDDLREEVSQKQVQLQDEERLNAHYKNNYETVIRPKMQQLFLYLKELVEYLNVIETPEKIIDYSARYPQLDDLYQQNFRLSSDKHGGYANFDTLTDIYLRYVYLGRKKIHFRYEIEHKVDADKEKDFLFNHNIPFEIERKPKSNTTNVVFRITKKIPVVFKFSVDHKNSHIILKMKNHENFEFRTQIIDPNKINEPYLDELARYILKKDDDFFRMDIDDISKEMIRINMDIEKQKQDDKLKDAIILKEQHEQEQKEKAKLSHKLKTFFSKKL